MAGTPAAQARSFRFGPFELDVRAGELRKHGIRIKLREQPVQILLMLLDHPGEVVLREEIRLRLWPNNTIVEFDHGINAAIQKLRDALGETADRPRYVETVARRGYRFLGEVERLSEPQAEPRPEPQPAAAPVDADDLTGKILAHYRIVGKLGEGGMGVVYRAEDLKLGRQVALKFLPGGSGELPESVFRRFEREARAASALNHPHICTIHGLEDFDGQPAIVMELVEGETLAARLAKGPLPLDQSLALATQIAGALAEAHRRGIVPSRSQAGQHHADEVGREGVGFRLGENGPDDGDIGRRRDGDAEGRHPRHAVLYVARAGAGEGNRRAQRYLLLRPGAL
jgi:DNA-binding winged helix-turn-helix (wHTH) protein